MKDNSREVKVTLLSTKPDTLAGAHCAAPIYPWWHLFLSTSALPTAHLYLIAWGRSLATGIYFAYT